MVDICTEAAGCAEDMCTTAHDDLLAHSALKPQSDVVCTTDSDCPAATPVCIPLEYYCMDSAGADAYAQWDTEWSELYESLHVCLEPCFGGFDTRELDIEDDCPNFSASDAPDQLRCVYAAAETYAFEGTVAQSCETIN